jgi:hypothetical protein
MHQQGDRLTAQSVGEFSQMVARQIYGKLGIENRREVVSKARELGFFTPVLAAQDVNNRYLQTADTPYTSPVDRPTHNLPLQLTTFVGRTAEIEQVKSLLSISRLVTPTGTGGVGKTRLAVVSQLTDQFSEGLWLVELAPLGDPAKISGAIASIFGLRADQNRSLQLVLLDYLTDKQHLLILDNCEHLIESCAELADSVLRRCPRVNLLATSRDALNIEGERAFYVPSLPSPDPASLPKLDSLPGYGGFSCFSSGRS